jgi:hypothetical protein
MAPDERDLGAQGRLVEEDGDDLWPSRGLLTERCGLERNRSLQHLGLLCWGEVVVGEEVANRHTDQGFPELGLSDCRLLWSGRGGVEKPGRPSTKVELRAGDDQRGREAQDVRRDGVDDEAGLPSASGDGWRDGFGEGDAAQQAGFRARPR